MIQLRPILFALGLILCVIAFAMLLPAIVDLADGHDDWKVFLASAVATFFIGGLLVLFSHDDDPPRIGVKEGFLLTTLCWIVVAAFASLPFIGLGLSVSDAYFESMSGLTTTGSTVMVNLDKLPRGVLLWRALLNGLGGLGIVVMAIIMLPFLRVGGMQLFQAESSDRSEKVVPRAIELTVYIAVVYGVLIVVCAATFLALGMSPFDAICHSLATIATGGFSTHDASFGFFNSPAIEWATIVFMILGALPFVVLIKAARGNVRSLVNDEQVRGFVFFVGSVCLMLAAWLTVTRGMDFPTALTKASFNIVSVVTTTGFASTDYTMWGSFAVGVFFLLTFVGGCAGSTAGGIKIYRLQVTGLLTRSHFVHLMSPSRIVTLVYNGRRLPADVPFSVVAFLAIYMATVGLFTVVLTGMGLDLVTALSGSAQALGNVGPGLGDIIGPAGNFSGLPAAAKWVLAFAMLLGRLELFTVLVLFRVEFWRS
ncbi:MAG: TrkH family potassium uptake protein [Hyphomicrobiaceae bacterium]|nr:TrkH family potassium uptake protein [Hyphomicrobiaceae bacterium]